MVFFNLKLHSEFSLLEAPVSLEEYIKIAKEYNQKCLSLTDNSMFGAYNLYNLCKANDIKPIIGLDIYVSIDNVIDKFCFIAKNNEGLKKLYNLSTTSYIKKNDIYLMVEKIDVENLGNDIIIIYGSYHSNIFNLISENRYKEAFNCLEKYNKIFQNFYLELPLFELKDFEKEIYSLLAKDFNSVLSSDVYYLKKEDKILQKFFSAIKENKNINTVKRYINRDNMHFKSLDEIKDIYDEETFLKGMENLKYIYENVNITIETEKTEFPSSIVNDNLTDRELIEKLINDNIDKKYKENKKEALERVKYELDIIEKMGYIKYFFIVYDFVKYAKENDIYVGPGRGSAAGSIISYLLNITEIDPLKHELIFERFLNPGRISMPDIDMDIEQERRGDVIEYLKRKYTPKNVSQIITFATFKPKLALKESARILGISEKNIKKIYNDIGNGLENIKIDSNNETINKLIYIAKKIENKRKNLSTHAAGVIISNEDLGKNLPLYYNGNDYQVQFEADVLEKLGYLKMDILGLKNLNIVKSVVKRLNIDVDIYNLPYEKAAFDLLNNKLTLGIFQCESEGITALASKLKINKLEDISLLLALYRPGPLESGFIDILIERKNNNRKIEYFHEILEEILKPTYGIIVYQEQVMQIAQKVSNYTLAEADELRKAIGKKNPETLKKHRDIFIKKSIINKEIAAMIYNLIEKFGNYGFNKAHAVSYATITYQTAYFKAKYPLDFYASVLSSELKSETKLNKTYRELKFLSKKIYKPDINESEEIYSKKEDGILISLSAIKEMSEKTAKDLVDERKRNGVFKDFIDFCLRTKNILNKSNIEGLIYSGCFDKFNINRKTLINNLVDVLEWSTKYIKSKKELFSSLFLSVDEKVKEYVFKNFDEFSINELVEYEKEYIKISFSQNKIFEENAISKIFDDSNQYILGYINKMETKLTKKNILMGKVNIYTRNDDEELLIFPSQYKEYGNEISENELYIFKVGITETKTKFVQKIYSLDNIYGASLDIKISKNFDKRIELKEFLNSIKGNVRLKIYVEKDGEYKLNVMNEKYNVKINNENILKLEKIISLENISLIF